MWNYPVFLPLHDDQKLLAQDAVNFFVTEFVVGNDGDGDCCGLFANITKLLGLDDLDSYLAQAARLVSLASRGVLFRHHKIIAETSQLYGKLLRSFGSAFNIDSRATPMELLTTASLLDLYEVGLRPGFIMPNDLLNVSEDHQPRCLVCIVQHLTHTPRHCHTVGSIATCRYDGRDAALSTHELGLT